MAYVYKQVCSRMLAIQQKWGEFTREEGREGWYHADEIILHFYQSHRLSYPY